MKDSARSSRALCDIERTVRIFLPLTEQRVRFLPHPVLSSLLISVGMLRILLEMRTPGIGSLAQIFWGHWLVQLAGWEELSLADRACLALAMDKALPVLTADRAWGELGLDIDIRVVR